MTKAGWGVSHPTMTRSPTAGRSGQRPRARLSVITTVSAVWSLAANDRPATRLMPIVSKSAGSTALLVTRTGESGDSDAQSDPAGISGNDEVRAARRTPG